MLDAIRKACIAAGLSDVMAEEVVAGVSAALALDEREHVIVAAMNWLSFKRGMEDFLRVNPNSRDIGEFWQPNMALAEGILVAAVDDLTEALAKLRLKH